MKTTSPTLDPETPAAPGQPAALFGPTTPSNPPPRHGLLRALLLLPMALLLPHAGAQGYVPVDIVAPEGAYFSAQALNDAGQVCGSYVPPAGHRKAAVWDDGAFTLLPLLPGTTFGTALGLNNVGQVVGFCSTEDAVYNGTPIGARACIWENGTVRELATVAGASFSKATAINDAGTAVGAVYSGPSYDSVTEAVIWKGSLAARLIPPSAGTETHAQAIDSSGRVAAVRADNSWLRAGRWTPDVPNGTTGTMVLLGDGYGLATDINNAGTICGGTTVWYGMNGFELPFSTTWCHARSLNDAGVVVGDLEDEEDGFAYTPFVWDSGNGTRDLNTLLAATTANAYPGNLESALAINNAGQILVRSLFEGNAILLTPAAEEPALVPPVLSASVDQGAILLSWTGMDSAWSYRLKRATVSGGPYTTIATVTEPMSGNPESYSHADATAQTGVRYYYVASAVHGPDESADSPEVTAIVLAPPAAPTNLTANVLRSSVKLAWKPSTSPEIVLYRIYRSANAGAYTLVAEVRGATSYTDSAVTRRTAYAYKVTSVNINGQQSPASNVATARLK